MNAFESRLNEFYKSFGTHKAMVLSTSVGDKVSSRMMSIICIDGEFFFQTDKTSRKCIQISKNKNAALCIENIQIEGTCEEYGTPAENQEFLRLYKKCYPDSFAMYSSLKNEILFKLTPSLIQRWIYESGRPYIETFDFLREEYKKLQYILNGDTNDN